MNIYGVIGWPIKHSLSPAMHNAAFKELGIEAEYKLFEVRPEELEDFILNRKDVAGFNITIPHKIKVREILQKKFHVVKDTPFPYPYYDDMTGAVNTVTKNGEDIEYCNTDPIGFRRSLLEDLKFKRGKKSVLVIGCGGASRAVVAHLSDPASSMKKIYLYDISKEAVDSAKKYYSGLGLENKIAFIYNTKEMLALKDEIDLLVNASPVGMEEGDDRLAAPKDLLRKGLYVFDLVYNRKTGLFKEASALGCHVVDGKGMLAAQGTFSFSLWTGTDAPVGKIVEIMKKALNSAINSKLTL